MTSNNGIHDRILQKKMALQIAILKSSSVKKRQVRLLCKFLIVTMRVPP